MVEEIDAIIGIYCIINKVSGKCYIGQSANCISRIFHHYYELNRNRHFNVYFQSAWNKYGKNNFYHEVLEICQKEDLNDREIYWVDYFGGFESKLVYNLRAGGRAGGILCEESRLKISNSLKGNIPWNLGVPQTEEQRNKISLSRLGYKHRPETVIKMRLLANRPEVIAKSRKAHLGIKQSAETIEKRVSKFRGIPCSEETKQKISRANLGKTRTDEQKKRISEATKAAHIRKKGRADGISCGEISSENI